ncbi:hypothetical protein ACJX0J_033055, partial [Zea mays]
MTYFACIRSPTLLIHANRSPPNLKFKAETFSFKQASEQYGCYYCLFTSRSSAAGLDVEANKFHTASSHYHQKQHIKDYRMMNKFVMPKNSQEMAFRISANIITEKACKTHESYQSFTVYPYPACKILRLGLFTLLLINMFSVSNKSLLNA